MSWILFAAFALSKVFISPNDEKRFVTWMKEQNYAFVGEEYQTRLGIFISNLRLIQEHNAAKNYQISANKFAALTPSEYRAMLSLASNSAHKQMKIKARQVPETLDWREDSYVPGITDSGFCASWGFAAVVPFSHLHYKSTQNKVDFSPWNIIDCNSKTEGCTAGSVAMAWEFVKTEQNGAINTLSDYNQERPGECRYDAQKAVQVMTDYAQIEEMGDETALMNAVVTYGPVVSSIDGSVAAFQLYCGGIFDDSRCSSVAVNHQLVVIGYGNQNGLDYWLCQNFWGSGWGEDGYVRLTRNKNVCGIATYAWFVY